MRLVVDLTLPIEARLISQTRRIFSGYLEEFGASSEDVSDVVLALDEACTNVMRHAFGDAVPLPDSSFRLSAEMTDDEIVVTVEDEGRGLPADADHRPVDLAATSGRGLQIIRRLMTSVDVQTAPERQGTRLQMRKDLRAHH